MADADQLLAAVERLCAERAVEGSMTVEAAEFEADSGQIISYLALAVQIASDSSLAAAVELARTIYARTLPYFGTVEHAEPSPGFRHFLNTGSAEPYWFALLGAGMVGRLKSPARGDRRFVWRMLPQGGLLLENPAHGGGTRYDEGERPSPPSQKRPSP